MTPRLRATAIIERNVLAYRRMLAPFLTGFLEPLLYLGSIGIGVGALVGGVEVDGRTVPYEVFVAPGLFVVAAMNGAIMDTTFGFFVKFKYGKTYDAILVTPLGVRDVAVGEVSWAVIRGGIYATVFLLAMLALGLIESAWAVLALPVAMLVAFAFAGAGLAASTFMRSFVDFDFINLAMVPLFLFSATFFPLDRYPDWLARVISVTPLYQGVALSRAVVLGDVHLGLLAHAAYLLVMGAVGVRIAGRRLGILLQP
ncbi:ABC transporter permease [Actinomarinicola tropica]|uniref:ABC transporter permease n=1 Tax=Actinomarinicola tropica TaxID=2789776 RepID=UPI001E482994|nr:ABC transporter permease [Actinomarinicola tropica]